MYSFIFYRKFYPILLLTCQQNDQDLKNLHSRKIKDPRVLVKKGSVIFVNVKIIDFLTFGDFFQKTTDGPIFIVETWRYHVFT